MAVTATKKNVLLAAALLGFLTSLLIYKFLRSVQVTHQTEMVTTVITAQNIQPRTVIESWMLRMASMPRDQVPGGVSLQPKDVVGKVALVKIPAHMPVGLKDVGNREASLGLAYVIPNSMRAVTVGVDPVIGVAGFLKPGDRVDVVATFDNGQSAVARTVIQNAPLLALGSQVKQEQVKKNEGKAEVDQKDTATLVVTPEQAERLVLAENQGKLRLVLRGINDYAEVPSKGVSCASMTGCDSSAKVTVTQEPPSRMTKPFVGPNSLYALTRQSYAARPPITQAGPAIVIRSTKPVKSVPAKHEIELIRGTAVQKVEVNGPGLSAGKPPTTIKGPLVEALNNVKETREDDPNIP